MVETQRLAVSRDLHRRIKLMSVYRQQSIQKTVAELIEAGFKSLAEPNIHDVGRDSDPVGEPARPWNE
ncbi:MAG: hypothetical protein BWX54_02364 [Verrucomicrobia bacterium ADurb.Bin018]|nr:MAG: hypothetical protein BWX54_02364 [Verrucomicrobia bacterium ADurb.Bin018]